MLGITGYDNNYYEGNEKASKVPLWGQQPGAEPGTPVPPENNTIIQLSGVCRRAGPRCSFTCLSCSHPTLMGTRQGWDQQMRNGKTRESLPSWCFITARVPWKPVSKPLHLPLLTLDPVVSLQPAATDRACRTVCPGITVASKYPGGAGSCQNLPDKGD